MASKKTDMKPPPSRPPKKPAVSGGSAPKPSGGTEKMGATPNAPSSRSTGNGVAAPDSESAQRPGLKAPGPRTDLVAETLESLFRNGMSRDVVDDGTRVLLSQLKPQMAVDALKAFDGLLRNGSARIRNKKAYLVGLIKKRLR